MHFINSCIIIFTYDSIKLSIKWFKESAQPSGVQWITLFLGQF